MTVAALCAVVVGCGGPPTLYPVTGKVTLGGKAHSRLMVYFRPASGEVTEYNLAVGETDADGNLGIMSVHGGGLQAGDYKVSFRLYQNARTGAGIASTDKPDEKGVTAKQVIRAPYDADSSHDSTPVTFTVKSGSNEFVFDIPRQ